MLGCREFFNNTVTLGEYMGAVTYATEIQWELYHNRPMGNNVYVDDIYFK